MSTLSRPVACFPDMARDSRYDILFEPVKIGPVTAPNRFYQVPHCNGMGYQRPDALAEMRAVKAEGGWGVVCTAEEVDLVERYCKEQGLFRTAETPDPRFTDTLELDLSIVEPSLAGPKRPHDRVALSRMKESFRSSLVAPVKERGFGLSADETGRAVPLEVRGEKAELRHGSVVIAAITSCTNTSNPSVMLGAGLLARKARQRGLKVPSYVKTSLAPGSKVVTEYLEKSGLLPDLEALGFGLVGYGCTTCIGNSGPLPPEVARAVTDGQLVASAVLSSPYAVTRITPISGSSARASSASSRPVRFGMTRSVTKIFGGCARIASKASSGSENARTGCPIRSRNATTRASEVLSSSTTRTSTSSISGM